MILTTKKLQYLDIIQQISEESIAKFYLGVGINKPFNSYFRDDPIPSARLYYWHNRLYYNDFLKSMTLSDLIMYVKGWSYKDLLANIKQDFMSGGTMTYKNKKVSVNRSNTPLELKVKYRSYLEHDLAYFGKGGITQQWLESAHIYPIEYYFLYNRTFKAHKWAYTYDYYIQDSVFRRKIYQPLIEDKAKKWLSNVDGRTIQNYINLPRNGTDLIIPSSFKDCGVVECNLKIPSISPNTENSLLPGRFMWKLKQRFPNMYTFHDQDLAGHIASEKYRVVYNTKPLFIPEHLGAKDPFAYCEKYDTNDFKRLGRYLIENYERNS